MIEAKTNWFSLQFRQDESTKCILFPFLITKRKRPDCSKFLEEQSEAKGISPMFSKLKVKRIGVF